MEARMSDNNRLLSQGIAYVEFARQEKNIFNMIILAYLVQASVTSGQQFLYYPDNGSYNIRTGSLYQVDKMTSILYYTRLFLLCHLRHQPLDVLRSVFVMVL